jgi:Tol biopolymer transport system component
MALLRVVTVALFSLTLAMPAAAQVFDFFRIEGPPSTPGGLPVQATAGISAPALSADGRTVVFFAASGSNLSGGASGQQVLAYGIGSRQISLVSVAPGGAPAAGGSSTSGVLAVSGDARYVAFETTSSTYTGGAAGVHIVRMDRASGTATRVNVDTSGNLPSGTTSRLGGMSADGRFVAFSSNATTLVAGASNTGIYVRDLQNGTTERVDVGPGGVFANASASTSDGTEPSISADGRLVAFLSPASNLLGTPLSGSVRVYVRDRQAGTTTQASLGPGGTDLSGAGNAAISSDGSRIVFRSSGPGATATQLWLRRLADPAAIAVPAAANMGICDGARVSNAGFVVMQCRDVNPGLPRQVYIWGTLVPLPAPVLVSGTGGNPTPVGNAASGRVLAISPDNRVVAFDSDASNLVASDTNSVTDAFVLADPILRDQLLVDSFE